jgi:CRP-like cAMP-binding protein
VEHDGRWISPGSARRDLGLLTAQDLSELREFGTARSVEPGEVVLAAGARVTHVLAVVQGELDLMARLHSGRATMAVVRRGGVLADIPLLLDAPMPFDAVATQPSDLITLSRQPWMDVVTSRPALCLKWMRSIARRLDDDRRRLVMAQNRPLVAQVAYLLLDLAERDDGDSDGDVPRVRLSHATMAQILGARRQSVSRALADLRQHGLIETRYGTTGILDEHGLTAVMGSPPLP